MKTEAIKLRDTIAIPQDRPIIVGTATMVCESGNTYEVKDSDLIGYGGEALVYKAKKLEKSEKIPNESVAKHSKKSEEFPNGYIAKLNDQVDTGLFSAIRTRVKVIKFLTDSRAHYTDIHIAPLIDTCDYSYVYDGIKLNKNVDFYPLAESCEDKKFSYSELRKKIIPQLLCAINALHIANLVHRDIKPGNIYILGDGYYLADFGTASMLDAKSGKDMDERVGETLLLRATRGYMAPEVAMNGFYTATDYYSLGCTIATLYKGQHVYQELINDPAILNRAMAENGLPLECKQGEDDLQTLVSALILSDYKKRPNYDDVLLWLKDTVAFKEKFQRRIEQVSDQANTGYIVSGEKKCFTGEELVKELLLHWEDAIGHLYRGGTNSPLIVYYRTQNQAIANELAIIVDGDNATKLNYRLGLARTLYFIRQSSKAFYWEGVEYSSLADIAKTAVNGKSDCLKEMLKDKYLSWILNKRIQQGDTDISDLYSDVCGAEELYQNGLCEIAVDFFVYTFAKDAAAYEKCTDEEELFAYLSAKHGWRIYDICEKTPVENRKLFAFLAYLQTPNMVISLISAWKKQTVNDDNVLFNVVLLFELFESICDKKKVRQSYLNCGVHSMLYWLQKNINLYYARTSKGEQLKKSIRSVNLTCNDSIVEINRKFIELERLQINLIACLENVFMTYYGISDNSKEIIPQSSDALFVESFYGNRVTTGYLRYMGLI